jgi:uncharacterized membrane protein YoaK (UPF0700 family)
MNRYDNGSRALAVWLSAIAGYVDAVGFLKLGGFFVSFMSGNSTRMAVAAAQGRKGAFLGLGLIGLFVLGVAIGSVTGRLARGERRTTVLALVSLLLVIAASSGMAGHPALAIAAMVLAMGAENAAFESDGEVRVGVTYMTGTLVKVGQRLAAIPFGGDRMAWAPFLILWLGLMSGAIAGAAVYPLLGLNALWPAAGAAALAAVASRFIR